MNRGTKAMASHSHSKVRSKQKVLTENINEMISAKYPQQIPITLITAISKKYGSKRPLQANDKFLRRFAVSATHLNSKKFLEYLGTKEVHEKGKKLSEQSVKRIYDNSCNPEGGLTFEYIKKMGEDVGLHISEKTAKAIIRKYGKRKDHLNLADCLNINERRERSRLSTQPSPKKKF